jgi:hypothetical protein
MEVLPVSMSVALGSAAAALRLVEAALDSAAAAQVLAVTELVVVVMAVSEVSTAYSPPLRYHS